MMQSTLVSGLRVASVVAGIVLMGAASCYVPNRESGIARTTPPPKDAIFTSTAEVMGLKTGPRGTVWAATTGGVLHFDGSRWRKWTRWEGLPSHEALAVGLQGSTSPTFWFPTATAIPTESGWSIGPKEAIPSRGPAVKWCGEQITAGLEGLTVGEKTVALPPNSNGTHVTGIIPRKTSLLVALFGDGLWEWDGKRWARPKLPAVPVAAQEITALAQYDAAAPLWLGTRRSGVFRCWKNQWQQFQQPGEPVNHNIQYLEQFNGELWASTLEDGIVTRGEKEWRHSSIPQLSTVAVRQLEVFNGALWARHGDGYVDKWDGARWIKNVFPQLPRGKALSMDAGESSLVLGQWGGWSEWGGTKWTHHFDVPELKNIPIIGVHDGKQFLWLLTQSRGVIRWDRDKQTVTVFDERHGLPDDWITAVREVDDEVYAGTFVGGLARLGDGKWETYPELKGENVTALEPDGLDGVWVATRHGIWRVQGEKIEKLKISWLDEEAQALKATPEGLWVGARTSLNWVSGKTLRSGMSS